MSDEQRNDENTDNLLRELNSESQGNGEIQPDESSGRVNHPLSPDALKAIIHNRNTAILNLTVATYDPHNVAEALEQLEPEDMLFFFKAVRSDDSAQVFTYLDQDNKEKVVKAFSSADLQHIVDDMSTDNLVDFVDDLPANLVNKVLKATNPDDRSQIYAYLRFKDDSAGTLMTPEYLSVKDTDTVKDAIVKIRLQGQKMETIWEIFVTDNTRRLVGTVKLDRLLESDETDVLKSIMDDDFVSVNTDTDQEVVVRAFRKYDISVLPVTNKEQRMLGIITFDDVIDVANAENTEDIQLGAAVTPSEIPYLKTSVFRLVRNYVVWIIVLLALNTFTSMTVSYLDQPLAVIPLLTAFLPTVMGTAGNASDQTATVIVRELALGNVSPKTYFKTAWKEFKASAITALILSVVSFGWILVELYSGMVRLTDTDKSVLADPNLYNGNTNLLFLSIASLVALSFLVVTVIAKWLGVSLPMLAKLCHLDPAVMSQPLISNILDVISCCFYFLFAKLIMFGI
jgi:magnesium transporter